MFKVCSPKLHPMEDPQMQIISSLQLSPFDLFPAWCWAELDWNVITLPCWRIHFSATLECAAQNAEAMPLKHVAKALEPKRPSGHIPLIKQTKAAHMQVVQVSYLVCANIVRCRNRLDDLVVTLRMQMKVMKVALGSPTWYRRKI